MKTTYIQLRSLSLLLFISLAFYGCKKDNEVDPVTASFSLRPSAAEVGDTVSFINNSLNASFFQWDFGDGGSSTDENPSYVYEEEGEYEPSLIAIGSNDSDTATQTVSVTRSFDVTIFPALGIEGLPLYAGWGDVKAAFTSDTSYYFEYRADNEIWYHEVYYFTEGIGLIYYSDTSIIRDDYGLAFIFLLNPYPGGTEEGVGIGSAMAKVLQKYGAAENVIEDGDLLGYWYDSKGIDFYSLGTGEVDEIDIYDPANFSKKSTSLQALSREMIRLRYKNRR